MSFAKVSCGSRKKICKLPNDLESARKAIALMFPELREEAKEGEMTDDDSPNSASEWHLEYDNGVTVEDDDDWQFALEEKSGHFYNFQIVLGKGSSGPKSYVPACLRCEQCECRGRKKITNLRELPEWYIKSMQARANNASNGHSKPAPSKPSNGANVKKPTAAAPTAKPTPQGPPPASYTGAPEDFVQQMTGYVPDPHIGQWTAYARKRHVLMWMLNQFPSTPRSAKQLRVLWPSKNKPKWKELHYLLNNETAQGFLAMNPTLGPEPMFMLASSVPQ